MDEKEHLESKCGLCTFSSPHLDSFIAHFKERHALEDIRIKIPTKGKRKYSVMNYGTSISKLGDGHFYIDQRTYCLHELEFDESDGNAMKSPDTKRVKLVSTPVKQ